MKKAVSMTGALLSANSTTMRCHDDTVVYQVSEKIFIMNSFLMNVNYLSD